MRITPVLPISLNSFQESLRVVKSRTLSLSREEIIMQRLEEKLGKSREEIRNLISSDLLGLLAKVPFNE